MQVALFEPEIPQNTGNIIRLCANTGVSLALIEPLGFSMSDKLLRRAGLDYHAYAEVQRYAQWSAFLSARGSVRMIGFSSKASLAYHDFLFQPSDILLFGPETRGLPQDVQAHATVNLRIPMMPDSRSLNLSNSVAVAVYEALRQQGFPGLM